MEFVSPYMHEVAEHRKSVQKKIAKVTTEFIGNRVIGFALDIGERSKFTEFLEKHFRTKIANTNIDLDVDSLTGKYDTIFCFEVIEHLFNPLNIMLQAHKILKDDGRLYLSTPKAKPHFLWWEYHFHEFHKRELLKLIKRAGFEVVKIEYHRVHPLWLGFTGFRPFLRMLMQRKCLVELRK